MSGTPPFEILLPEALLQGGVPDLRIASKFLALLAESGNEVQHLEVFAGMPLVNSPVPAIKQFLAVVNGARQLDAFISQVSAMLFPGRAGSKGSLCCVVAGAFTEFEITESGKMQRSTGKLSATPGQRPNNSFKPKPLRGSV